MWNERDRVIALVWLDAEHARCPGCGLPSDETTASGADDDYVARRVTCHACAARARAAGSVDNAAPGLFWIVGKG